MSDDARADQRPSPPPYRPAPRAAGSRRRPHTPAQPLNEPLTMASTYFAGGDLEYGRYGNPTWAAFEQVLGSLGAARCLPFAPVLPAAPPILDLFGQVATGGAPRHASLGSIGQAADLEARG